MKPIRVPRTPQRAFNKNRRPSALLLSQIDHLQWAALPATDRAAHIAAGKKAYRKPRTEGQAARRIQQLTAQVLSPAGPRADLAPPAARAFRRKPKRRAARRS